MNISLTLGGNPCHLVASCLGDEDTGGGLLYYNGEIWVSIDDVSTTGLFVAGEDLVRMLWAPSQVAESTAILHYNVSGLLREIPIQGFTDPHDVLWDGECYVAVSSLHDSIVWVRPNGEIVRRYQPAQGADCWHLNCLVLHGGVLHATAFGRFDDARGWVGHRHEGTGVLFRVDTGEDVLAGVCCPHTPRHGHEGWILCSSATSELLFFSTARENIRRIQLQGWLRGLTFADEFVLVGESVNRQLTRDVRRATVAVLDRRTWNVLGRLNLPYREVYDLVLVPPDLLSGLTRSPNPRTLLSCPPEIPRSDSQARDTGTANVFNDGAGEYGRKFRRI